MIQEMLRLPPLDLTKLPIAVNVEQAAEFFHFYRCHIEMLLKQGLSGNFVIVRELGEAGLTCSCRH
jgi:hypothetical protein